MKTAALAALTGIASGCVGNGTDFQSPSPGEKGRSNATSTGTESDSGPIKLELVAADPAVDNVTLNYTFDSNNTTQTAEFFSKTMVISERSSDEEVEELREKIRANLTTEQLRALREFATKNTSIRTKRKRSISDRGINSGVGQKGKIKHLSKEQGEFASAPCPTEENPITGTHTHDLVVAAALPCSGLDWLIQPNECGERNPKGWKLLEFKAAEYSNTISFDVLCPHGVPEWPDSKIGTTTEVPPPKTNYYALYNWKFDESSVQEEFGLRGGNEKVRSHYRAKFARHFIDPTGSGSIRVGTDFADIVMEGYKIGGRIEAESESGTTGSGYDTTPSI